MSDSKPDMSAQEEGPEGVFDLDALDAPGGMDAALAEYRAETAPQRKTRPVWVSGLAVALGVGLMAMMWSDFRYWLESEPREVPALNAAVKSGELESLQNRFVRIEGTPDITHIVPIKRESGKRLSFMRLLEGEDRVFVFSPRKPTQRATEFDGQYQGRLQRASSLDSFDFLAQAFALEDVRDEFEVTAADFGGWLKSPGASVQGTPSVLGDNEAVAQAITVIDSDELTLRFRPKLLMVQLGRRDFKTKADAESAVQALGRPYVWVAPTLTKHDAPDAELPNSRPFHIFLVSAASADSGEIEQALNAGLDVGDGSDPSRGAIALPRMLSYTVTPDKLSLEGDAVVFEYGKNTAALGHTLQGGQLVERELDGPALRVPLAELELARVRRIVRLDPSASVLVAEDPPVTSRTTGLLFLLVGAIVAINMAATASAMRKQA